MVGSNRRTRRIVTCVSAARCSGILTITNNCQECIGFNTHMYSVVKVLVHMCVSIRVVCQYHLSTIFPVSVTGIHSRPAASIVAGCVFPVIAATVPRMVSVM
jgi:hypothetical protein